MPHLKIIRASAGSGKTFSLTLEYLKLLLHDSDNFMHILAVTFTNKATEEMKRRIIHELFLLSSDKPSMQLGDLMSSTKLSESQIRQKSTVILKKILHQYSWFSVCTIDSFFQKIIRSFTREIGIQSGYAIELDTEMVLTRIIDRMMASAESNTSLLSWLVKFAESLIEKGESWNIRTGIRSLGKEIFRERFCSIETTLVNKISDRDFIGAYQQELYAFCNEMISGYSRFGKTALETLKKHHLSIDDFSNKSRGPAGFFVKIAENEFKVPTETAIISATSKEKWYTVNAPRKNEIEALAVSDLMPLMQQVIDYYRKNQRPYHTAATILKNIYTLGILVDLSQLADEWCKENDLFLLPDAPVFINKIIGENDTPFIYEKTGYWFHHFMIDEFQDTSLLQWMNFKPLISNSLSQNFDNLVVGDVKQSIYRWRNSNWEILDNIINNDFLPAVLDPLSLNTNRRSGANIIDFNNSFFKSASLILEDEFKRTATTEGYTGNHFPEFTLTDLFKNVEQQSGNHSNPGGFAKMEFLRDQKEKSFTDTVHDKLVHLLKDLQDKGFHLNDIAILTRTNNEAKILADHLLQYSATNPGSEYHFDVISDEALCVGNSTVVCFMISLLRHMINPADRTNNYHLLSVYQNYLELNRSNNGWLNSSVDNGDLIPILPEEFHALVKSAGSFSLIEIIARLKIIFHLDNFKGEYVYLQAFDDIIIEFMHKQGRDINAFLEYWQETASRKAISAPSGQDAIRILTIHKSKGLEFKIVLIPYCTWELNSYNDTILWCTCEVKPFNKLPVVPVSYTTKLKDTFFANAYYNEYKRQLVDNLNLLYVAFTRARDGLFVFCKATGNDQLKSVSDLAFKVFEGKDYSAGSVRSDAIYELKTNPEINPGNPVSLKAISERFRVAFQGKLVVDPDILQPLRPLNEGKILHEMFKMIQVTDDIVPAVTHFYLQGNITKNEKDEYIKFIRNAVSNMQVSSWFQKGWKILNEAEIILPGGKMKRPDRIMIMNRQAMIVEYKFGLISEASYENQVMEYVSLMKKMEFESVEAYLWYVRLGSVVRLTTS